ncbi:hypothetical protein ACJX0J_037519, partial [Zea mays]
NVALPMNEKGKSDSICLLIIFLQNNLYIHFSLKQHLHVKFRALTISIILAATLLMSDLLYVNVNSKSCPDPAGMQAFYKYYNLVEA